MSTTLKQESLQLIDSGVFFREFDHTYWKNGKRLAGITGMLSRQLFPDKYAAVPEYIMKKAAEKGSRIHAELQDYDMFGTATSTEMQWYEDLKKEHGFETIDNEYLVTDSDFFASAIDKVIVMNGKVYLADVKTTYKLDKLYISWQLSIYKHLFCLLNPDIEVEGLLAIWVREGASLHEIEMMPEDKIISLLHAERNGLQYIQDELVPAYSPDAIVLLEQLRDTISEIKRLDEMKKDYEVKVKALMDSANAEKWETDFFTVSRTKGYTRDGFDSKKLKEEQPEIYKQYYKPTDVKPSIKSVLK